MPSTPTPGRRITIRVTGRSEDPWASDDRSNAVEDGRSTTFPTRKITIRATGSGRNPSETSQVETASIQRAGGGGDGGEPTPLGSYRDGSPSSHRSPGLQPLGGPGEDVDQLLSPLGESDWDDGLLSSSPSKEVLKPLRYLRLSSNKVGYHIRLGRIRLIS